MTPTQKIIDEMMRHDAFSRWLGIKLLEEKEGIIKVKMKVRNDMLNGYGVAHGGISFSLADTAFAFASNISGKKAVSIDTSINHVKPIFEGDELVAVAQQENSSKNLSQFIVRVTRNDILVALFKGLAFRKQEEWKI